MSRATALARVREFISKNPKSSAAAAVGTLGGLGALTFLDSDKKDEIPKPKVPPATTTPPSVITPPGSAAGTPSSAESAESVERPGPAGTGKLNIQELMPLYKMLEESQARALQRDVEAQLILQKATEDIGMKKTLEQSRRQVELENIRAWRDITAKQYEANAAIGLGMAEIAYRATQPNPGVLAATQAFARTGMESFGGKLS